MGDWEIIVPYMVWFVWRFISWKFSKRAMHTNWGFKFSSPSQNARNPLNSKDNHTVNLFIFLRSVALLALSSLWMKYMTMLNRDPVPLKFVANLWTLKTIVWSLGNPNLSFTILRKFEDDIFPKYDFTQGSIYEGASMRITNLPTRSTLSADVSAIHTCKWRQV